jgi:hypothetical protein
MTKKDKIGWALVTPLLTALAGGIILTVYVAITEQPVGTLGVAMILAAIVGVCILERSSEDHY